MAITLAFLQIFEMEWRRIWTAKLLGASFGAQDLQEFHVDVVVTWGCRLFRLLQSSWNLFREWMRKTLVRHLLQKSSALYTNLVFKYLVVWCLSNLDEISSNGIGADWWICWIVWLLSSTKPTYQCPTLPSWLREVHLWRQFFPMVPGCCIEWLGEMVSYVSPRTASVNLGTPHPNTECTLGRRLVEWNGGLLSA